MSQHPTRIDLLYKIAQLISEIDHLKVAVAAFREWLIKEQFDAEGASDYGNACSDCISEILAKLDEVKK